MAGFNQVLGVLKQLAPLEVLEICELQEDAELLTDSLEGYIEENLETVVKNLISNGLLEESEDV